MPDQNPIVEAEPSGAEGVSTFSSSSSRSSGILAGRFRWVICGLLFLGVTKNYMDRQVLGVLKIPLQHEFGWNDIHYGHLVFAFQAAYALGMILVGRLIDRLGTRNCYASYRAMDCRPSWLALGIPADRIFGICLAHSLAVVLSKTRRTSFLHPRGTGVH